MEFYTLNRFLYLKYYVMVLYYQLMEYPLLARIAAIMITLCVLFILILIVRNVIVTQKANSRQRKIARCRARYYEPMKAIALNPEMLDTADIAQRLDLPVRHNALAAMSQYMVPLFLELYREIGESLNMTNWRRLQQAFRLPAYFDRQIRSRTMRNRIMAFKNIADINADLKEAVASRYLYAKDAKLKMNARFHVGRFGTTYPFKVLEEDTNLVFTEEMMVKYHNLLVYRAKNNLPMPNFVQWCNRTPVNEDLREFAVNEIRLFHQREDCPDLLNMLKSTHDERFACALIRALGALEYYVAEEEFRRRFPAASLRERNVICEALGTMHSGLPEVVPFLENAYLLVTDVVSGMTILRVLYNYGPEGREAFNRLKQRSAQDYLFLFEHIESPLIKSERYA